MESGESIGSRTSGFRVLPGVHSRPLALTLLIAAFLLLPSMASIGMFMDGIMYAAISRNLADGLGSLWTPHFSHGLFAQFREHPPLVFWLQSLLFRVLGDSYLTERAYDLVAMLAAAVLIRLLWSGLLRARGLERLQGYWWLPLLLWVIVPKWSWAYRNNVLENTMTVFCLLSVLLVFAGLRASGSRNAIAFAGAAAIAALLAFLAKGPVGLFVLVAPVLMAPALGQVDWRRVAVVLAVVSAGFGTLLGLLLLIRPEAREMLAAYWHGQVAGRAGLSIHDLSMLVEIGGKIVPMLLVLAAVRVWIRRDAGAHWWRPVSGASIAMLAVGLSASGPLLLGDLDSAHYLVPALPFLALGFGLLGASMMNGAGDRIAAVLKRRLGKRFVLFAAVAAAAILVMSLGRIGQVRKNEHHHAFLAEVAAVTGTQSVLAIDARLYDDWYLHAIAQRHYRISLVAGMSDAEWRLAPVAEKPPAGYRYSDVRNARWTLLQRRAEVLRR